MKPVKARVSKHGQLAETIMEALRIAAEMTDKGASPAERDAYVEGVLRQAWPVQREWKYLCGECADTGWRDAICTTATPCGRPFSLPKHTNKTGFKDYSGQGLCAPNHSFVTPCWCGKGQAFRRQLEGKAETEDVLSAGATKRKMTRLGR